MVSELVTNAVLHGTGTISLRIDMHAGGVRIEVADEGNVAVAQSPVRGWSRRLEAADCRPAR
jgi:anti-sigma regulatory factor (Ser/Thr protein kinase)